MKKLLFVCLACLFYVGCVVCYADDVYLKNGYVYRNVKVSDSTSANMNVTIVKEPKTTQYAEITKVVTINSELVAKIDRKPFQPSVKSKYELYSNELANEYSDRVAMETSSPPWLSGSDKSNPSRYWEQRWTERRRPDMQGRTTFELDWKYSDRAEIDGQSYKYLDELRGMDAIYFDPFLEDYLTQMLHKVVGPSPIPGRPGTINILVMKNPSPNAFALNNGVIFVTTGMLSLVRTEAELRGVLAHEVAHIVLDHNLLNYSSAKSQKAWSDFFTVAGAVLGGVSAAKSAPSGMSRRYYEQYLNNAMLGGALFLRALSTAVMDIIGAAYSRSQEEEADLLARDYLISMGNDGLEYGDLLKRLGDYSRVNGLPDGSSLMSSHPEIKSRLDELKYKRPKDLQKSDGNFDSQLCECLVFNASLAISNRNYEAASKDLDRAIATGSAVEEAYLLKAIAVRHLDSHKEATIEALGLLEKANQRKTLGYRIVNSEKALLYLRLGDTPNALKALDAYIEQLSQLDATDVTSEMHWAKGMRAKCVLKTK